jgi:hypothetical protein
MSDDPQADQVERDNARIGYQAAISLATFEGNIVWSRYGSMLLIHTIMLSAVGLASNAAQPAKSVISIGLSLVGLLLCVGWWVINDVGFRYFFAWMFSARELEERYLAPARVVKPAFPIDGEADACVVVAGKTLPLHIAQRDRRRVAGWSKLIIGVFGVVYVALLIGFLIYLLLPVMVTAG